MSEFNVGVASPSLNSCYPCPGCQGRTIAPQGALALGAACSAAILPGHRPCREAVVQHHSVQGSRCGHPSPYILLLPSAGKNQPARLPATWKPCWEPYRQQHKDEGGAGMHLPARCLPTLHSGGPGHPGFSTSMWPPACCLKAVIPSLQYCPPP